MPRYCDTTKIKASFPSNVYQHIKHDLAFAHSITQIAILKLILSRTDEIW